MNQMNPVILPLLLMTMGASALLTIHHLWMWLGRRTEKAHLLLSLWCGASLAYQTGRYIMYTSDSISATLFGFHLSIAVVSVLFIGLASACHFLVQPRVWARALLGLIGLSVLMIVVQLGTPWFFSNETHFWTDALGSTYRVVEPGPLFWAYAPYSGMYFCYCFFSARRAQKLPRNIRRGILAGLCVYLVVGMNDIFIFGRALETTTVFEYGFLAVAIGFTLMLVHQFQAVHEQAEVFQKLVETSGQGIGMATLDGHATYVNPAMSRLLGDAEHGGLLGRKIIEHYGEDCRKTVVEEAIPAVVQKGQWTGELAILSANGEETPTVENMFLIRDSKGKPLCLANIITDTSEQKLAQEALRESEEQFRTITSAAQDAIIMMDEKGDISHWNRAAESTFGCSEEEAIGRNLHTFLVPKRFHEAHREAFPRFQETGKGAAVGKILELAAVRKNGEEFPVELSLSAARIQGQWHAIGVMRDITKRKREEKVLQQAKEAAETANRAKSEFLANMSHEIRTPMNGIMGMTELVLNTDLDAEQRECLQTALGCSESLLTLINDILDFSKIEAGRFELEITDFDPAATVEGVANLLALQAAEKNLEMAYCVHPGVPTHLRGDPVRLRQVIVNLLGNAVKFTESGDVALAVTVDEQDDKQATLLFSVCDTGIGIPAERQAAIFDSFTQADGATTRKHGGTGLGLTIARQIVELMGGEIWVESEVGRGSTFQFRVPFARSATASTQPPDSKSDREPEPTSRWKGSGPKPRILVAEDNAVNRKVAAKVLRNYGCDVTTAVNGRLAVELLEQGAFDLVFMDVQMPEMDGLTATKHLREDDRWNDLPIVAMTAHAMAGDQERCLAAGMNDYVSKPVNAAAMHAMVEKWARAPKADREGEEVVVASTDSEEGRSMQDHQSIDVETALDQLAGDRELFDEALDVFMGTIPEALGDLQTAASNKDAHSLQAAAHSLKGAAATVCAEPVRQTAEHLEEMGERNELQSADSALDDLQGHLDELRVFVETLNTD